MTRAGVHAARRTVAGTRTRVIDVVGASPRPPLVLLHGYTDSADTWRPLLELCASEGRAATAVDLPEHGEADRSGPVATLAYLDRFVADVIEDAGPAAIVVGNSLGALLALRWACAQPPSSSSPARAVVALGAPRGNLHPALVNLPRSAPVLDLLLRLPVPDLVPRTALGWAYEVTAVRGDVPPSVRAAYRGHLSRAVLRRQVALGVSVLAADAAGSVDLTSAGVPVLCAWGSEDRICPPPETAGRVGHPDHVLHPGLSHCPQLTHPRLVLEHCDAMAEALRAVAPDRPGARGAARSLLDRLPGQVELRRPGDVRGRRWSRPVGRRPGAARRP